jgi:molybdopterin synthase catalytic subunit
MSQGESPRAAADAIALTSDPIDTAALTAGVQEAAAGGVCVFLGTTRQERDAQGRRLLALDYEAYPEMAQRQLQDLARGARQRWPIVRLALVHRTGRVPLGEASVLIAVSTPHRGEAFEACRWLIDTLKADLAVWKKEIWEEGEGTWSPPNKEWRGAE